MASNSDQSTVQGLEITSNYCKHCKKRIVFLVIAIKKKKNKNNKKQTNKKLMLAGNTEIIATLESDVKLQASPPTPSLINW